MRRTVSWCGRREGQFLILFLDSSESLGNSVGIALGYGLDYRGSKVRFPAGARNFSLHYRVHNGSGAHQASCPMGTRGSFPGVKRPGHEADHSPLSSVKVKEWLALYLHSPNTPSWRGAQLKKAQRQLYSFNCSTWYGSDQSFFSVSNVPFTIGFIM
jgi:hypothetical protein